MPVFYWLDEKILYLIHKTGNKHFVFTYEFFKYN
jgi:hypothetical protein